MKFERRKKHMNEMKHTFFFVSCTTNQWICTINCWYASVHTTPLTHTHTHSYNFVFNGQIFHGKPLCSVHVHTRDEIEIDINLRVVVMKQRRKTESQRATMRVLTNEVIQFNLDGNIMIEQ